MCSNSKRFDYSKLAEECSIKLEPKDKNSSDFLNENAFKFSTPVTQLSQSQNLFRLNSNINKRYAHLRFFIFNQSNFFVQNYFIVLLIISTKT